MLPCLARDGGRTRRPLRFQHCAPHAQGRPPCRSTSVWRALLQLKPVRELTLRLQRTNPSSQQPSSLQQLAAQQPAHRIASVVPAQSKVWWALGKSVTP